MAGYSQRFKVTVLICTLNEEESLPRVLCLIPEWVHEVLLVDGRSNDRTVEVAKGLRPDIRVVYQPGHGKGDALCFGIQLAEGDVIVTLDADGQMDPGEIDRFLEVIEQGYDFAKGTRFTRLFTASRPLHRNIGNWIITLVFDLLFFVRYSDVCSGYNAFKKEAMLKVDFSCEDGLADEPLIHARVRRAGLRVKEVPHRDLVRVAGASKAPSFRQGFRAVRTIVQERFRR